MTSEDTDQMPSSAASDIGLHCLPMSKKKNSRLLRVNVYMGDSVKFNIS